VIKVYNTLLFYKYERIAEKAIQGTFDIEKGCWCGKYGRTHNSSLEKKKKGSPKFSKETRSLYMIHRFTSPTVYQ